MSGRIDGTGERAAIVFTFDGRDVTARDGDTIAMALWAAGDVVLRHSSRAGAGRGVLCNMGVCYECLVHADGVQVRGCTTLVRAGMRVERGGKP